MEIRWGYTGKLSSFSYLAVCQARIVLLKARKQEVKQGRSDLLSKLETCEQRRDRYRCAAVSPQSATS